MTVAIYSTAIATILALTAWVSGRLERRQGRKNMPVQCDWCLSPTLLWDAFSLDYVCPDCDAKF